MQVEIALDTFVIWLRIILAYALLVGIEGPALLLVARYRGRPWREQLLAALPVGAFVWMVAIALQIQAAYDSWRSYIHFQDWHYPPAFAEQSVGDVVAAAASVPQLGLTVFAVAGALILMGWLLVVIWDPRVRPAAKPAADVAPMVVAPVPLPSSAEAVSADSDEFEMRVEPIVPDSSSGGPVRERHQSAGGKDMP